MGKPKTIMIYDQEYVRASDVPAPDGEVKIAILQRGWIAVGYFSQDGSDCLLRRASIIRKWGTTRGLGELISGPLESTILDPCGTVRFHELATVALLDCDTGAWESSL